MKRVQFTSRPWHSGAITLLVLGEYFLLDGEMPIAMRLSVCAFTGVIAWIALSIRKRSD